MSLPKSIMALPKGFKQSDKPTRRKATRKQEVIVVLVILGIVIGGVFGGVLGLLAVSDLPEKYSHNYNILIYVLMGATFASIFGLFKLFEKIWNVEFNISWS